MIGRSLEKEGFSGLEYEIRNEGGFSGDSRDNGKRLQGIRERKIRMGEAEIFIGVSKEDESTTTIMNVQKIQMKGPSIAWFEDARSRVAARFMAKRRFGVRVIQNGSKIEVSWLGLAARP